MASFRIVGWIQNTLAKCKGTVSRIRWQNVKETISDQLWIYKTLSALNEYKYHLLKGFTAVGLISAISIGGNQYVKLNTNEVYHVLVNGQDAGAVSDPEIVQDYIEKRNAYLEESDPEVHRAVDAKEVEFEKERGFKLAFDDHEVVKQLDQLLKPHTFGTELLVNGKVVGIVKDEATANRILEQVKEPFVGKAKDGGEVKALSADSGAGPDEVHLEKAEFIQKVDLRETEVQPDQVMDAGELLQKLKTGDVQPTLYTVQEGDCVSCIAKKFNISKQVIYDNNPWIQDDMIKVGDQLNLTVLQPTLAVKTVEKVVENQEVQYDTRYIQDDSMRVGENVTVSPGKNGLKKVTFEVTKINGQMQDEQLVSEQIVQQPVSAVVKKGTKVVLGEGSGKFAWPVSSPTITSGFGTRWGKLHKGIDMVSGNRNILAADNGRVVFAGVKSGYGNCVIIDHQNGYETLYGHMSKIYTSVGKIVEKGEKIGYMGSTGDSTGVHLHFEIHKNSALENPIKYLNQ